MAPTSGLLGGLHAASLGVVGLVLALVAHVAARGLTPGPVMLFLLAGLIGLAAVLLPRVQVSAVRTGMSVMGASMAFMSTAMRLMR
jgi:hypothetical protein